MQGWTRTGAASRRRKTPSTTPSRCVCCRPLSTRRNRLQTPRRPSLPARWSTPILPRSQLDNDNIRGSTVSTFTARQPLRRLVGLNARNSTPLRFIIHHGCTSTEPAPWKGTTYPRGLALQHQPRHQLHRCTRQGDFRAFFDSASSTPPRRFQAFTSTPPRRLWSAASTNSTARLCRVDSGPLR